MRMSVPVKLDAVGCVRAGSQGRRAGGAVAGRAQLEPVAAARIRHGLAVVCRAVKLTRSVDSG